MDAEREVYHNQDYLACFSNAFIITNACNSNTDSCSELGCLGYWELPPGMVPPEEDGDTTEADSYLGGSPSFKVLEIEVFKLEWKISILFISQYFWMKICFYK